MYRGPQNVRVGEFVIIACDRNTEDLGVVIDILNVENYFRARSELRSQITALTPEEKGIDRMLRVATETERDKLPQKFIDEDVVLQVYSLH